MKAVPWIVALVLSLLLVWSIRSGGAASQRLKDVQAVVDSLQNLRDEAEGRARRDSLHLDSVKAESVNRLAIADKERAAARRRASLAAQTADSARAGLAILLDSLGVSTAALDALVSAHRDELAAVHAEVAAADSTTASVRTLLMATEEALTSERLAHQAVSAEAGALEAEIRALESGRKRDRFAGGALMLGALAVAIFR